MGTDSNTTGSIFTTYSRPTGTNTISYFLPGLPTITYVSHQSQQTKLTAKRHTIHTIILSSPLFRTTISCYRFLISLYKIQDNLPIVCKTTCLKKKKRQNQFIFPLNSGMWGRLGTVYKKYDGKSFPVYPGITKGMERSHSVEHAVLWQKLEKNNTYFKTYFTFNLRAQCGEKKSNI